MESFPQPEKLPEQTPVPQEEAKEQSPVTPEQQGEKFGELLLNVALELGYTTKKEDGKNVLEKNGQTITMRHVFFPGTGQTIYQPLFEYKDIPSIKPATLGFYHTGELSDKEVKKTFKKQLEIYARRFDYKDNQMDLQTDHNFFNHELTILAEEHGYTIEKYSLGRRIVINNDQHTIKVQHSPYKSDNGKRISTLEILNNNEKDFEGNGTISAIEWTAENLEEVIKEHLNI